MAAAIAEMDKADKQILRILQENARTPIAAISRRVRLGETTVRYRIQRLSRAGVIMKFSTVLNPRLVGYPVGAILLFRAEPRRLSQVFAEIARRDEVSHLLQTTGSYDMLAVVHARSMEGLNELVRQLKTIQGVRALETWMTTGLLKINPALRLD